MSFIALSWSYTSPDVLNKRLSSSELAVLRALCWFYTDEKRTETDRNCFVSVEKICEATGLGKTAVNAAKKRLREQQLISWVRAANFDKANLNSNEYTIDCPKLREFLKRNQKERQEKRDKQNNGQSFEMEESVTHALQPSQLYIRPSPNVLISAFQNPLSAKEATWMADALAFVCDRPENRLVLYKAMRAAASLSICRDALKRVVRNSNSGRRIRNRIGYLLKAIGNGAQSETGRQIKKIHPNGDPEIHPISGHYQ